MYSQTAPEQYDGYVALGTAVIMRAVIDYLDLKKELYDIECGAWAPPLYINDVARRFKCLKDFFLSNWFTFWATDLDGQYLLEQLDKKFEEMVAADDFSELIRIRQLQID